MRVNYYFDTFNHLKSFDILTYDELVGLYLVNNNILHETATEKLGGWNERPINSDVEEIEEGTIEKQPGPFIIRCEAP